MSETAILKQRIREAGLKVTLARVAVLQALKQAQRPVGINTLAQTLPQVNRATLYRILNAFVRTRLAETCELGHRHADYRYLGADHTHFVVCERCQRAESVPAECCPIRTAPEPTVVAPGFRTISRHLTTYFGCCEKCAETEPVGR
jgi:Fe2+ or Zn2+ uptake regulation protein